MSEQGDNKKSRHFTVVVRRQFPCKAEVAFASWINSEIGKRVLSHGRYKYGVKEVDVVEGGRERYDDRWRNRLHGTTERRYLTIRPSKLIIAHAQKTLKGDMYDQFWATQELLLFKEKEDGCEVVAYNQCVSISPFYIHAAEDQLNEVFDVAENEAFLA